MVFLAGGLVVTAIVMRDHSRSGSPLAVVLKESTASFMPAHPPQEARGSEGVPLRPLPVSFRTAQHEWTTEDAKVPEVIAKLVHNPDEFLRMVDENDRIKHRQLVYRKDTVPQLLDRGQPLRTFTLPGLDGREVEVEVTEIHRMPDGSGGSVNGKVKGRFNSLVSLGFANGCESFNVLSPDEGLYLTADAREPGEVFVKEIDPNVYGRPPETSTPDFILTSQRPPGTKPGPVRSK
ncbi:hypothetical protein llg_40690 [Luteolibacter sp. LG18]|nr:hypothetical protein llg_40690 [Luteolibacter sp. LG18]